MKRISKLIVGAGAVALATTAPVHAGSSGLGLPDPGASIRQLNQQAVDRFNDSASQVRRSQRNQILRRKARDEAFQKERRERQRKIDLEREHSTHK
ncbi:MAG: hypothetical protein AAGF86_15835 [Pseudomonadota bacterium]